MKRGIVILSSALIALILSGCMAAMGLDTPERQRGDGTHRVFPGTADEVRACVRAAFGMMSPDFSVSDQGDHVEAVRNVNGAVLHYKAFLSPGPAAGETDVEMLCAMFSRTKEDDIKKCERRFLSSIANTVERAHLRMASAPAVGSKATEDPKTTSRGSDVDELPAGKARTNHRSYAIVIGIENYHQKLPKANFAAHDARTMTEYLTSVLGYPEENVVTLLNENATNVALAKYFERWMPNNIENGGSVFVYYSGHGAPNPKTGDAYLVPYDGDPSFIDETGYSLKRMYTALGKLPVKEIVVALDSCFSGAGGRSVLAEGARPLVMNLQQPIASSKNMTILTASSGEQISSTYQDKGHGLFTYFMLKGIKNEDVVKKDGTLDITALFGYIKPQVSSIARKKYNNEQTPQLIVPKKN